MFALKFLILKLTNPGYIKIKNEPANAPDLSCSQNFNDVKSRMIKIQIVIVIVTSTSASTSTISTRISYPLLRLRILAHTYY